MAPAAQDQRSALPRHFAAFSLAHPDNGGACPYFPGASLCAAGLLNPPWMHKEQIMALMQENPLTEDLALLFQRHTADMHADTPPESIHMLPRTALVDPAIAFFVLREAGRPVAMGAVKVIEPGHGEIKSMHVLAEERGRGLSAEMLRALIAHARTQGLTRLSLETGSQAMFLPARRLYEKAGFRECPPFVGYVLDPMSVFMTLLLSGAD